MRTRGFRRLLLLSGLLGFGLTTGCGSEADRVTGTWDGKLLIAQAMGKTAALRIVCHFQKGSDGALTGTLDSPDQGATGIPLDAVTLKDGAFHLQLNKLFASYDGQLSKDGKSISGQWKQGPVTLPLTLTKSQ